ncbi:hypothetical protein M427DRAFT_260666 [Gonapodya prolifera JEL478]|uniref:L domain-like protein n=1 Tax=Gonapodya prolifera (strain JEL478) TaxID=1344416 RepID=A0A139AKW2_GONPJ|nr:hypothetical protein M427DRAFT_260666 [Gonapodya prolifera JEL478]|eukprot:KXS17410.1 hypothetical protein M427DRAFT_260666 [Gonapodya prolifera JEL478]
MRPIVGPTLLILLIAPLLASHAQETYPSADCAFFESLLDRSAVSVPWNRGFCCNYSVDVTLTDGGVRKTTRGFTCRSGRVVTASVVNFGLNGTLPSLENFTSLEIIELNNNNFTGAFPSVMGLKNLTRIYGGSNFFTTIPDVSGNPNLEYLVIPRNEIIGTIPNLTSLKKLFSVSFYDNKLEGAIDGLLPQTLSFCSLTNFNTNPKLFTVSGDLPKVCLSEDQIIPFPNGTAFGRADGGNRSSGGPSVALIGACAGGAVVVLIGVVVGFAYYRKKRRRMNEEKGKAPDEPHCRTPGLRRRS